MGYIAYACFIFYLLQHFPFSEQGSCDYQPRFLGLVSIYENVPIGTVIFNYSMFANNNDIVSVVLNFPTQFVFNINTNQLISNVIFDTEVNPFYPLSMTTTCTNGTQIAIFSQSIVILGVNDNAAQWQYNSGIGYYNASIPDNAKNNTSVTFGNNNQPAFTDVDSVGNYAINLIDPLGQVSFYVSSIPGTSPVSISSNGTLDYDLRNFYNLTLFLMDMDIGTNYPRFNATALLYIYIIDTDSKPPIFEYNTYQFQIYSNATNNSVFSVTPQPLRAYDGDIRFNSTINYKFTVNLNYLSLNASTGVLQLIKPNPPTTFMAVIMAYQVNNVNVQSLITVQISIININNLIPVKFTQKIVSVYTLENVIGTLLQLNFSYNQIQPVQLSMQPVVQNFQILSSGLVLVVQRFYYHIINFYNFTITASDNVTSDQMNLLVYIINVNQQQPTFSANFYNFRGILTSPSNIFIIQVTNYDANTSLTFQLVDVYGIFNISNSINTLYLSVANTSILQPTVYYLQVMVSESGTPPLSNSVNVTVDFTNPTTTTIITTPNTQIPSLLALYILLPIIIILILTFTIILCYYKKRRVFKATGSSLAPSLHNFHRDSFINRWKKSSEFHENVFNLSDIYHCDSHVGKSPKDDTNSVVCATIESYRKRIEVESVYFNPTEMKELVFFNNLNAQSRMNYIHNN